jgi:hypothetical protein
MRAAQWALPFVVVLAVSSMLAYALDGALLAGAAAANDATPAPVNAVCAGDGVMVYAGLDSRIPVMRTSCANAGPLASGQ